MKGAITVIYSNMKRNKMDPKVLEILEKLREYNTNVTRYNLEIGDIVRTPDGTYRYKVQDVENGLVTLEDGTSQNIDFRNMQKEEMDCNPTLWNIL